MGDGLEIERKFLVARLPDELGEYSSLAIRQGYVAAEGEVEVRLRDTGDACFETVKAGAGLVRRELEVGLEREQFEVLWPATEGRRVEKTRYRVEMAHDTAELDVYHGELEGLATVEVEFESVEASSAFVPPEWFGQEITGDTRYTNRNLAVLGLP